MHNKFYWPYVSTLAGSFFFPLRKNLLGSKPKANNHYFAFIIFVKEIDGYRSLSPSQLSPTTTLSKLFQYTLLPSFNPLSFCIYLFTDYCTSIHRYFTLENLV